MPTPSMTIRMIKDVLRLKYESKQSHAAIAAALHISKGVVSKYVSLAAQAGLTWDMLCELDETAVAARLLPGSRGSTYVPPDYARIHQELRRKGVTLTLLWQEYVDAHPGGKTYRHTQFCERYHAWAKSLKRSMRQIHKAGEKLFIDYAGPTIAVADGTRAHVFVATLGASSYTFACATPRETMVDWIGSMVRALSFIGGTPELIVPDNPRALIAHADRYEPRANDTVLDFARHYGTSVLPARARRPQDKAKVEVAVQIVERWIMARLRHQRFETVQAVDRAIAALLPSLNERPFQKLPGSRASAFAALDAPALRPLPAIPYEIAKFRTVKVHIKRYGNDRLEAACAIALELGAYQYRHVKSVLETDRDRVATTATAEWSSPDHAHLRGPGYYQ